MRILLLSLLTGALLISVPQWGRADDVTELREEFLDLRAKAAAMESARMAPSAVANTGSEAEYLVTEKKKARMHIGGDVAYDIIFKHRDDSTSDSDTVDSTTNYTRANLRFRVNATRDTHLYVKLDLDDTDPNNDLIEECRFVWNQVRGSGWGFVLGKGEVPYGQDKTLGIVQSYHHNDAAESSDGPVFVLARTGVEGTGPADPANPHNNVGNIAHPGEVDNVGMVGVNYLFRNDLKLEFAVFQNTGNHEANEGVLMHEDRPNDTFFFQSFATRLWWAPNERLQAQLSFINEHRSGEGDKDATGNANATDDQYALSVGLDYLVAGHPIELFGEYQHGWDWNYTDGYCTDTYQLGMFWTPREAIRLGLMGEWLSIDDEPNDAEDDYTRVVGNLRYQWPHDMYVLFEAAYEWYDGERKNDDDIDREGLLLAFRMGWAF